MSDRKKVLFLCTGNSCRSQMAEAIVNARLGDRWEAYSAGTEPVGYVHSKAIQALAEIGIMHHGRSKSLAEVRDTSFDLVITVCDAAAEACPVWLGRGEHIHHGYPDPAQALGDEEAVMAAFREVRDAIVVEIPALLARYEQHEQEEV